MLQRSCIELLELVLKVRKVYPAFCANRLATGKRLNCVVMREARQQINKITKQQKD